LVKSLLIISPDKPNMLGVSTVFANGVEVETFPVEGTGVETFPVDSGEATGVDGVVLPENAFKIFAGSDVVATVEVEVLPLDRGEDAVLTGVGVGVGVGAVNCEYALLTFSAVVP
jgi:hypothetical protein